MEAEISAVNWGSDGVNVTADQQAYRSLAKCLQGGHGSVKLKDLRDENGTALKEIQVQTIDASNVFISIGDGNILNIAGSRHNLDVLAQNFSVYAEEYKPGEHLHLEYFPNHSFLDSSAIPLILNFTKIQT